MNSLTDTISKVLADKEAYDQAKSVFDASVRGDEGSMSVPSAKDQLTVARSRFEACADALTNTINDLRRIFTLESSLEILTASDRVALNRLLYEFRLDSLLEPPHPRTSLEQLLPAWKHAMAVRSAARELIDLLRDNDLPEFEQCLTARTRIRSAQSTGSDEVDEDSEVEDEAATSSPQNDWDDAVAGFRHTVEALKAANTDAAVPAEERAEYEHSIAKEAARLLERTSLRYADQLGEFVRNQLLDLKIGGRFDYVVGQLGGDLGQWARYAAEQFQLDAYVPKPQVQPESRVATMTETEVDEELDTSVSDEVEAWLRSLNRDN